MRLITAKYPGRCQECGQPISKGDQIFWQRGYAAHAQCNASFDSEMAEQNEAARERRLMDSEYAIGMARAQHIRDTAALFGEDAAVAEELAWELRDPSY